MVQNDAGIFAFSQGGTGAITGVLTENFVSGNKFEGILTANTGALLVLERNTVTHNSTGIGTTSGAALETRSNNTVRENATNLQGAPYTLVGGV